MAKKKHKRGAQAEDDAAPSAPPAPAIGTAMGALLTRAGLDKAPAKAKAPAQASAKPQAAARPSPPKPPPKLARPELDTALGPGELSALNAAYRGVQPIKRKQGGRVTKARQPAAAPSAVDPEERAARERLSA